MRLLVPAPIPGRIPTKTPIAAERIMFQMLPTNSFMVNPKPRILVFLKSEDLMTWGFMIDFMTVEIAKAPVRIATWLNPLASERVPNVKRVV